MTHENSQEPFPRRLGKAALDEKINALRASQGDQTDLQDVLHELEVHQIELEMQNRELRESRQALEESLDRYVSLYDFAPTGYVTLDDLGQINDVNLTLARILGADRQRIIGRSLSGWVLSEDLSLFRAHVQSCRTKDEPITTELRLICRDKSIVYVELMTAPSLDIVSTAQQFRTAVTDISARKRAEQERDKFFDLSSDLLSISSTNGYFRRLNPAWLTMSGYTSEELLSHPFIDFIHPDDRDATLNQLKRMSDVSNSVGVEARFIKKDRSIVWLTWKTVLAADIYYSVARDTTYEHYEKLESENEQSWSRELIETIPVAMMLIEANTGNMLSKSVEVHHLTPELGKDVSAFLNEGYSCEDAQGNILEGDALPRMRAARGEEIDGEQILWRTPTTVAHFRVFSRNIPAKYGRPATALLLFQDISNLKKIEKSLSEAVTHLEQERELRERFVSTLTHDLRTPLSAVRMASELILKSPKNTENVEHLARLGLDSVERLDGMVTNLLDANRISGGEKLPLKRKDCNFVALVKKTLQVLSAVHGDRFKLEGLSECRVFVDARLIRRLIENLCNNAVKYGDPQTAITIRTGVDEDKNILRLSVHNLGPMIPLVDQSGLFDPFYRSLTAQKSGKKGWGIGLTLVRGIADSHGGHVHVVSTEEQGTTFEVELPYRFVQ